MTIRILEGDCRAVMATLPDASVDSIVTDPPYELGFMGKKWDGTGIANDVEVWRHALRVLKPGGYLLAFSGSRTYHRMVCAIEDASFEIRDQIMWLYGSGFPKSLDVSKAIDKAGGDALAWRAFSVAYGAAVEASSLTHADIDRALGIKSSSCYWARVDHRGGMPPRNHWDQVRSMLALPSDFVALYDEAERQVLSERMTNRDGGTWAEHVGSGMFQTGDRVIQTTASGSDAARQWEGWGTALKPAHEPIVMARKPLIGTVAANVLAHGTGAVNIDGCRVPGESPSAEYRAKGKAPSTCKPGEYGDGHAIQNRISPERWLEARPGEQLGRWPANVIHDGSDEVVTAFPQTGTAKPAREGLRGGTPVFGQSGIGSPEQCGRWPQDEGGSAARFFYTAKASSHDRHDGLANPGPQFTNGATLRDGESVGGARRGNHHPTVKPTDLMRYLVRLVTPPGGTVLDPFMGSGSTLKAAEIEQFNAIGIELDPEYAAIARRRIASDAPLFAEVA